MNIFIASLRTWAPTFVYLISEKHTIDFYGCKSNCVNSKNVRYLGSYYKNKEIVIDFLKSNWKKYDLIIMPDFDWQIDFDFQILKKIISVPVLCPSLEANIIEQNKLFSKKLFEYLDIPSPSYRLYESVNQIENLKKEKFVFKLTNTLIHSGFQTRIFTDDSYKRIIPLYFKNGYTGNSIIEDYIEGKEAVLHFLCNGKNNLYLGSSRDYKKINDNDQGMNISSAGSYSRVDYIDNRIISIVTEYINKIQKLIDYVGIMCVGIILNKGIPYILEINVRPGVPEFNTLLLTLDPDSLLENLYFAASRSSFTRIKTLQNEAVTIQIFHKKYSAFDKPDTEVPEILNLDNFIVSYFEKEYHHYNYYASVSYSSINKEDASKKIYDEIKNIDMKDYMYRKDIGYLE